MKNSKRFLALLICVGMVFLLLTSSAYLAHEADHDCIGEGCEICQNIALTQELLQSFALLGIILLFAFFLFAAMQTIRGLQSLPAPVCPTLVSWKIRLNN